jgi:hypothetical protein
MQILRSFRCAGNINDDVGKVASRFSGIEQQIGGPVNDAREGRVYQIPDVHEPRLGSLEKSRIFSQITLKMPGRSK